MVDYVRECYGEVQCIIPACQIESSRVVSSTTPATAGRALQISGWAVHIGPGRVTLQPSRRSCARQEKSSRGVEYVG